MKYLKFFENKKSDDAIQEFKKFAEMDFKKNNQFYEIKFLTFDLPYDVQDEFKLLIFMYYNFNNYANNHSFENDYKKYVRRVVKKDIQKSLINKLSHDIKLLNELERNKYIKELQKNEWFFKQKEKFIFMAFETALRNLPPKVRAMRDFNI